MRSYTRPGLADAAVELLEKLGVTEAVVFGWSLGGHIGIEMIPRFQGMRGLMVSGTLPIGRNNMAQGFVAAPRSGLAGRQDLTEIEIDAFVQAIFGRSAEPFLRDAVARADGRVPEKALSLTVETSPVPLAVVNGEADRFVNLDYFDTVAYANLWEGRCHRLAGLGHAPFWEAPDIFNSVLERFLRDIETAASSDCGTASTHRDSETSRPRSHLFS
jgi:pimeloyl-ACP methyl ester carboxylesterase